MFPEESEGTCQTIIRSSFSMKTSLDYNRFKYIQCKDILRDSNLRSDILSITRTNMVPFIDVVNSTIPEINPNIFSSLNLTNLIIEADVQIIQEMAFENCTISAISLDNNRIQKIKSRSFNTSSLLILSLNNNSLNEIMEKNFAGLYNLRKLSLQNNRLLDIQPYAFKDLQSLEELDLSFNRLDYVPLNIFRTTKYLQKILLNNNQFKELSAELFAENSLLQYLDLQNNYLTTFDGHFPSSLLHLDLSNNFLTFLNVSNLANLNILVLDSNKLTNINNCLLNLPGLSQLHLNHNHVGPFLSDKTFGHLKNLTMLEIDNNHIVRFDVGYILELKSLIGLSLAKNNISFVDFRNVTMDITYLNLSANVIGNIRNLSSLKNLESLELSHNNIDQVNYDILSGLSNLRNLWLHNNSIGQLQRGCFRDLRSLVELDLSNNELESISAGVLNGLYTLGNLDLSHNRMTDLDEDIFHSTKTLRYLNIAFNRLSNVNVKGILAHTMWLREINVNGNSWGCKDLIAIIRDNKGIVLISGTIFNVSNVNGIPCNESKDAADDFNKIKYYKDVLIVMNDTLAFTQEMSKKFNVINVLILFILLVVCIKFIYEKFSDKIKNARQFVYKKAASEQELQLS